MTDGLFDAEPYVAASDRPADWETMSAGRRLTWRQRHSIDEGLHPLSLGLGANLPLLPDNPPVTPYKGDEADRWWHKRCGNCVHRIVTGHHDYSYPKCDRPGRATHGAATDVRAWWPACRDYQPQETP